MSERAVRILHFFGRMDRGGAEMRTVELARAMDRRMFEHHFVSLKGFPGKLDEDIRGFGGTVHMIKLSPSFPIHLAALNQKLCFG